MVPELKYIPLDKIRGNPVALRDVNRQSDEFTELVGSVKKDGVITAISVRRKPGEDGKEFELVDGLQRFSASQEAGTGTVADGQGVFDKDEKGEIRKDLNGNPVGVIPAQIIAREDADALTAQIIANAHKIETKPVEYARSLMRYLGYNPTMTEAQLAGTLNKSPQWINKMLGLLKLHDNIKPLVNEGRITVANAYVLAKLPQDEQLNWLDRAQTEGSNEFSAKALARVKEIRDANRKGTDAGEEGFVPVIHLRKKTELEQEMKKPEILPALIRDLNITKGIKPSAEGLLAAATAGAALGVKWALSSDERSIEAAKQKDAERRKRDAEQKIRRDAEKTAKKEKEASEKAAKAREEAAKAREAAAKLPPVEAAPAATEGAAAPQGEPVAAGA